jgi:hypothetical protein
MALSHSAAGVGEGGVRDSVMVIGIAVAMMVVVMVVVSILVVMAVAGVMVVVLPVATDVAFADLLEE